MNQSLICVPRVSQPERKSPAKEGEEGGSGPMRFAVRSLGWVRIAEEDLTPERSSKAVNKCIVDLSLGRNDINDAVGRWGDVSGCLPASVVERDVCVCVCLCVWDGVQTLGRRECLSSCFCRRERER